MAGEEAGREGGDPARTGLTQDAPEPGGAKEEGRPPLQEKPALPRGRKICYAIGGAPYQLTENVVGFFFQTFLLDVVQMEPFHASLVPFLGRAWNILADPVVGILVARSPRRKCGKLIPWTVSSMPFGVVFYILLWFVPSESLSAPQKFFWHWTMYCLFQTCMSCYHVPYSSLTMFLGGSEKERDSATSFRMAVEVLSTLVGSCIQAQMVGSHHAAMKNSCDLGNVTLSNASLLLPDALDQTRKAYVGASLVLGSIYCFSCLVLFFGVEEHSHPSSGSFRKTSLSGFLKLGAHRPFTQLLGWFLLMSLAFQLIQGSFVLFNTHVIGQAENFQYLLLIMLGVACVSIYLWQCFLERFGKKTTVYVGLLPMIPVLTVLTLGTHGFLVYVLLVAMAGSSLAILYLLPWSMLPDVVDDFKLHPKNADPTCHNLEPLFYSSFFFVNKLAGGISLGVSTMSLHFAGYRATDCVQRPRVILALRLLMAPAPMALLALAMVVLYPYPVGEKRRRQTAEEKAAAVWNRQGAELSDVQAIYTPGDITGEISCSQPRVR
uniref:Sodium-dependent lysophosphatidylcholine symporter 1-like n=1 Tax=Pogona vitticeps TaxID=103695 RepID=A0ABM5G523_9SAUR